MKTIEVRAGDIYKYTNSKAFCKVIALIDNHFVVYLELGFGDKRVYPITLSQNIDVENIETFFNNREKVSVSTALGHLVIDPNLSTKCSRRLLELEVSGYFQGVKITNNELRGIPTLFNKGSTYD